MRPVFTGDESKLSGRSDSRAAPACRLVCVKKVMVSDHGWSAGIPLLHAVGWRGDQGGDDVIGNTLDTQTRAPDQQAHQVTGQSPQY
jgi:hypothetical protein